MTKRAIIDMTRRLKENGFTFLEIAISLAIISIVFVSLTTLFNTSIGLSDYSEKMTAATFLAQKIMTEIELENNYEQADGEEVALEDVYEGYSYKLEMRDTFIPLVREVDLTVYFSSALSEHELKVTTYITGFESEE
jgi:prepilin-type N-terminal cleavage/methylation domain-containing protein